MHNHHCPCGSKKKFYQCCGLIKGCDFYELTSTMQLERSMEFRPVYKFLDKKEFAINFKNGSNIRLSTLKKCRNLENENGRDEAEGTMSIHLSSASIQNTNQNENKRLVNDLKYMGMELVNCQNFHLKDIKKTDPLILPDAYVICTSYEKSHYMFEKFGDYCVKISRPYLFSYFILLSLRESLEVNEMMAQPIKYKDESIDIANNPINSNIGFIKRTKYNREKEFRALYRVAHKIKKPHLDLNNIQGIRNLCELVNININRNI